MVDVVTRTDFDAAILALQTQLDVLNVKVSALQAAEIPENVKAAISVIAAYLASLP